MTSSASGGSRRQDPAGDDPLLGRVLDGRYRIEEVLGTGGVGVVYRATHLALQRAVAIKVLHDQLGLIDELRRRFEREAQVLSALSHPNIVAINDYGIAEGTPYLVMELLEGRTLADLIDDDGPPEPDIAVDIARQTLRGLAFAHDRNIVHRDLKAANIFLVDLPDDPHHVKILDFGLAKMFGTDEGPQEQPKERTLTKSGTILGTPAYMSPEQASGSTVDERSDVYSAGVVLFELLTGRYPFVATTRADMLRAHMLEPVPFLSDARPGLEAVPELEDIIHKAMSKERPGRFRSAQAMLEAVDALPSPAATFNPLAQSGEVVKDVLSQSSEEPTVPVSSERVEPSTGPPPPTERLSPGRRMAVLAGVAVLALVLALVAALASGGEEPRTADAEGSGEPPETGATEGGGDEVGEQTGGTGDDQGAIVVEPPVADAALAAGESASDAGADDRDAEARAELPAARDPFNEVLPRPLRRYHFKVRSGRQLVRAERRALQRLQQQMPRDPRATLILAHHFVDIDFWSDALTRYELAFEMDPTSRGDGRMLRDMVRLASERAVGDRAADLVVRIYGPEAIEEVEHQASMAMEPESIDRLMQLRDRLDEP